MSFQWAQLSLTSDNQPANVRAGHSGGKFFQTANQLETPKDRHEHDPAEPEHDFTSEDLPKTSILNGIDSYASLELGVAKIEIMHQENLKCIAMTSDGWRCQEVIDEEQLLEAREHLSSSIHSERGFDFYILSGLVLCPDHALGELPQVYADKWSAFAAQRLSKEEAMSRFDANRWRLVQFFSSEGTKEAASPKEVKRARSASNISATQRERHGSPSNTRTRSDFLRPTLPVTSEFRKQQFEFFLPNNEFNPCPMPSFMGLLQSRYLSGKFVRNPWPYRMLIPPERLLRRSQPIPRHSIQTYRLSSARQPHYLPFLSGSVTPMI